MKKQLSGKEMPYLSPMIQREDAAKQKGFTENFEIKTATKMVVSGREKGYKPENVKIVNYYRFEGMTDPGDNNILYELETNDGVKGVLITPYGSDCPAHIAEFVAAIPQIEKKHNDVAPHTGGSVPTNEGVM